MTIKEAAILANKKRVDNLKKELQPFIDDAYKQGYSGDYALKVAKEQRKLKNKWISPFNIKFWINKGLTEEEAKYKVNSFRKINKEYWLERGFTENEAIQKISDFQKEQAQKFKNSKKVHKNSMHKNYWIERGFTKEEAIQKVKERQSVGSLENFQKRFGKKEGLEKWKLRQINWQKTMNAKSYEEKLRINKLKANTLENMILKYGNIEGTVKYENWIKHYSQCGVLLYSEISQQLFLKILDKIKDKENVKFGKHNDEFYLKTKSSFYLYDFKYKDKIIEFNGDLWHANPILYEETDYPNPFLKGFTSKQIWEKDKIKNDYAISKGFQVLVIWEKEYNENKEFIVDKCLNFLNS